MNGVFFDVLYWAVGVVFTGGMISAAAGSRGGFFSRFFFFLISCITSAAASAAALAVYGRFSHLPLTAEAFFPDAASVLIGVFLYLLLSLIVGILLGFVWVGSPRKYFNSIKDCWAKKAVFRFFPLLSVIIIGAAVYLTYAPAQRTLMITEICTKNFNICAMPNGECCDYIEIYNSGDETVSLKGYALTDSGMRAKRHILPAVEVPPKGRVIAWASGNKRSVRVSENEMTLSFKLKDNETVMLLSPLGAVISRITVPELPVNTSYTLLDGEWIAASGTPFEDNAGCVPYRPVTLKSPEFSQKSGFYDDTVEVALSSPDGSDIYYTLDGSTPDENSELYERPLLIWDISGDPNKVLSYQKVVLDYNTYEPDMTPVKKGTVVRAVAIDSEGNKSPAAAETYFVGDFEGFKNGNVLSIVADPEELFGEDGICATGAVYDEWYENGQEGAEPEANFRKHGAMWEREASVQLIKSGDEILNQTCGIRVQGNASRWYPKKRFSFRARDIYSGTDIFETDIFGGVDTHSFSIRIGSYDIFCQSTMKNRDLGMIDGVPAVIFLNGELYQTDGILRERYDAKWFSEHMGVEEDDVVLISDSELDIGTPSDLKDYNAFIKYAETHDASDPIVYKELCARMDIQSYIEFYAANNYLVNVDMSMFKNHKLWRTRTRGEGYGDGKWRWCLYDMDAFAFAKDKVGVKTNASVDPFHVVVPYTGHGDGYEYIDMPIFSTLIKNEDFKRRFVNTYLDMINVDFNYDRLYPLLVELGIEEAPLYSDFLRDRPDYARGYLKDALGLTGEYVEVTVSSDDREGGSVLVNTADIGLLGGSMTGIYITDYPITLKAAAKDGFRFAGWRDENNNTVSTEDEFTCELSGSVNYTAVFVKEG